MRLPFAKQTKYLPTMMEWIHCHRTEIDAGHEISLNLGARSEFTGKMTRITIDDDAGSFETDWKSAANTFPSPFKGLAQTLQIKGLLGTFAVKYCDGIITIRKVDPNDTP